VVDAPGRFGSQFVLATRGLESVKGPGSGAEAPPEHQKL